MIVDIAVLATGDLTVSIRDCHSHCEPVMQTGSLAGSQGLEMAVSNRLRADRFTGTEDLAVRQRLEICMLVLQTGNLAVSHTIKAL